MFMIVACVPESIVPEDASSASAPEGAKVTIPITLNCGGSSSPGTKSMDLGEDVDLENLYVAVFGKSGYLKEYVKAQDLQYVKDTTYVGVNNESHTVKLYQFSVTLTIAESKRIIHVIGNGKPTLSFGYESAVMSSLLSKDGQRAYWQRFVLNDGIRAQKNADGQFIDVDGHVLPSGAKTGFVPDRATRKAFTGIPLVRNWAKISVTAASNANFTPYSYVVYNVPSQGAVAPHSSITGFLNNYQNYSFADLEELGYQANLPQGTTFDKTLPAKTDFQNLTSKVVNCATEGHAAYLYERPVPTTKLPPTSIIVYGHYRKADDLESEGDYFYKIDLMESHSGTSRYYPVYRNFQYQIEITAIMSKGHDTPAAAAAAGGSADVSADITASHLSDISDGTGRLIVSPGIAFTYTGEVTDGILSAYLVSDIKEGLPCLTDGAVTVEALPMADGEKPVIKTCSIDPVQPSGWRVIHYSTYGNDEDDTNAWSQTLRITGNYSSTGSLYRDVVITMMPVQPLQLRCSSKRLPFGANQVQRLDILIPDGLVESMFPLVFWIEPEDMTLTPVDNMADNNLPVNSGASISQNSKYAGRPSFHFVRTLSWSEYEALDSETDAYESNWKVLPCYFKSNCEVSGTTIWVANEYFTTSSVRFVNLQDLTFRNFKFTSPIQLGQDTPVTVHIDVDEDTYYDPPYNYPEITMFSAGMVPTSGTATFTRVSANTYKFRPTSSSVDFNFETTTSDGKVSLTLSAEEYEPKFIQSHEFSNVHFVSGRQVSGSNWSAVVDGFVTRSKNTQVLLAYNDHPDDLNPPITIDSGGKLTIVNSGQLTPTGPKDSKGEITYHEVALKTGNDQGSITLTLSAPGYLSSTVTAGRFEGSLTNQAVIAKSADPGKTLRPDNQAGVAPETSFSAEHPAFYMDPFTVTFDMISSLEDGTSGLKGLLLNEGDSYEMTIRCDGETTCPFFVQFEFRTNYKYNNVNRDLVPASCETSVGTFYKYQGYNNLYVWDIPRSTQEATIVFHSNASYPINITQIWMRASTGAIFYPY